MRKKINMGLGKNNLLATLKRQGIYVQAPCGGTGTCGKCQVRFVKDVPEPTETERALLEEKRLVAGWRLACESECFGAVEIEIPDEEEHMAAAAAFSLPSQPSEEIRKKEEEERGASSVLGASALALAVDIGTTTIAMSLVDVARGTVLGTVTGVNHQRMYGADVISRITVASRGEGQALQRVLVEDLWKLAKDLGQDFSGVPVIVSANTTMQHLLQGYSCEGLGRAPYRPVNLSFHKDENRTLLPGISAFVGADIVSGILACGMDQSEETSLLVDLGTNGEMVLGNRDGFLVTSAAAGPAFEGAGISCGMAGVPGAICAVSLAQGGFQVETIGGKPPTGICGTGIVEVVYALLESGWMDETGLLREPYFSQGVPLADGITFSQKDVRQVQLAKGAVRAGIEILKEKAGISYEMIRTLYVAGGFGQKLSPKKAVGIALLPEELAGKMQAVGNSSLAGAVCLARDPSLAERLVRIPQMAKEITLADEAAFQETYIRELSFRKIDKKFR